MNKFITGATNALLARAGLAPRESGNEFNGMSLSMLAAESLRRAGVNVAGMSNVDIARKVLATTSTSDFPQLMANTANRTLLSAYGAAHITWPLWVKKGEVSDFKPNTRHSLGSFSNLLTIPEGGEYKQGTFSDSASTLQAVAKGRYIELTRQLVVNDDLAAFVERARMLGFAAARTVEADVYASLTSASKAGPTMADGGALFNATAVTTPGGHANYTSSGTAISIASLNAGNQIMRAQTGPGGLELAGIRPKYLLVPPAKEMLAWEIVKSTTDTTQANPGKASYANAMRLEVVSPDYLSGNDWYLAADPNIAPLYEVAFLGGNDQPYIDDQVEFLTDALRMKVRLDYGIAPLEWRAGYRNAGA